MLKIGQNCQLSTISNLSYSSQSVCQGEPVTVQVNGQLNGAAEWLLSKGGCLGITLNSNSTGVFEFVPELNTTYHIRLTGGCIPFNDQTVCNQLQLNINPTYIFNESVSLCKGGSMVLPNGSLIENIQESFTTTVSLNSVFGCDSTYNISIIVQELTEYILINDTVLFNFGKSGDAIFFLDCNNNFNQIELEPVCMVNGQNAFVLPFPGSFAILILNSMGTCSDTSDCITQLFVNEAKASPIVIAPNPFNESFQILNLSMDIHHIKLFDASGKTVIELKTFSNQVQLSELNHLSKGVYFLQIVSDKKTSMHKLLKQ